MFSDCQCPLAPKPALRQVFLLWRALPAFG
jgi:hypothetical protein